jgi:plastocyanin
MTRALIALLALLTFPAAAGAQMMHGDHGSHGPTVSVAFASFAPADIDVLAGEKVTWSNDSVRKHDVAALDLSFNSGQLAMGAMYQHAFEREGAVPYFCTIHPGMRGTLNVHDLLMTAPDEPGAPGRPYMLEGRTALPAGTPISIESDTGGGFAKVTETTAGTDGTFSASVRPTVSSQLRAVAAGVQPSPAVSLLVLDRKVSAAFRGGRVRATVTPGSPGATVVLQYFLRERFGWWPVKTRKLDRGSHASFAVRPPRNVRARVVLTLADGATPLAVSPTLRLRPARSHRAR